MPHHDYKNDDEMLHSALDLFYIVYREEIPEALVHMQAHVRFMIGSIPDTTNKFVFYRIPAMIYDTHVAFETYPVRTIDDYLW